MYFNMLRQFHIALSERKMGGIHRGIENPEGLVQSSKFILTPVKCSWFGNLAFGNGVCIIAISVGLQHPIIIGFELHLTFFSKN